MGPGPLRAVLSSPPGPSPRETSPAPPPLRRWAPRHCLLITVRVLWLGRAGRASEARRALQATARLPTLWIQDGPREPEAGPHCLPHLLPWVPKGCGGLCGVETGVPPEGMLSVGWRVGCPGLVTPAAPAVACLSVNTVPVPHTAVAPGPSWSLKSRDPRRPGLDECRAHVCCGWAAGGRRGGRSVGAPGPTAPVHTQAAPALSPAPHGAEAESPWPR